MSIALIAATVDVMKTKLKAMEEKVATVQAMKGDQGDKGDKGDSGKDGKDGKDGAVGARGSDGKDGKDGSDGVDGVGVVDAVVDFDGHLVLTLSDGNEIDAGDLTDVWTKSEKIVQIIRGGGGGSKVSKENGVWGYDAGVSGTATLPPKARILQISATTLTGGTFTVNGGDPITLPANQQFTLEPKGNLVSPTLVFTGTTSYVVEYVT